jgi:hypothetical protein
LECRKSDRSVVVPKKSREFISFRGNGNENHELGTGFFVHKRIMPAVKRIEFVSDRMSYIIPRGCWFHIIVLNIHTPTEDKTNDLKNTCYEEFECIFNKLPK